MDASVTISDISTDVEVVQNDMARNMDDNLEEIADVEEISYVNENKDLPVHVNSADIEGNSKGEIESTSSCWITNF